MILKMLVEIMILFIFPTRKMTRVMMIQRRTNDQRKVVMYGLKSSISREREVRPIHAYSGTYHMLPPLRLLQRPFPLVAHGGDAELSSSEFRAETSLKAVRGIYGESPVSGAARKTQGRRYRPRYTITYKPMMQMMPSTKKSFVRALPLGRVAELHNSLRRFVLWAWNDS